MKKLDTDFFTRAAVLEAYFESLKVIISFEHCLLWRLDSENEEGWLEGMEGDASIIMDRETQEENFRLSFRSEESPLHWRAWKSKALVNAKFSQADVGELNSGVDSLLGTTSINTMILAVINEEEHCFGLLQLVNKVDGSGSQVEFGREDETTMEVSANILFLVQVAAWHSSRMKSRLSHRH